MQKILTKYKRNFYITFDATLQILFASSHQWLRWIAKCLLSFITDELK